MIQEKKAFVFDTNFIVQNKRLDTVIGQLQDEYSVYVTQISIDERIAQSCRELQVKFNDITDIIKKYGDIATIELSTTFEQSSTKLKQRLQNNYIKYFGNNIIPYTKDSEIFSEVLERAFYKLAPFSSADGASDKGFKDSLIWISILTYFKATGENEVIFVTDDNGFKNNTEKLCKEFQETTGKIIQIKPNSYYKDLISIEHDVPTPSKIDVSINISQLRDQIEEIIGSLCIVETEDYWGNTEWNRTFTLSELVDANHLQVIFSTLRNNIQNHIFDKSVRACDIFSLDERMHNGGINIPLESLENAMKLFDDINSNYPQYIQQFYSTAANIFNRNCTPAFIQIDDNEELPF